MRTSGVRMSAHHQHEADGFDRGAGENEGHTRSFSQQHERGEDKSPAGEQQEKPEKFQGNVPRRNRGGRAQFLHG